MIAFVILLSTTMTMQLNKREGFNPAFLTWDKSGTSCLSPKNKNSQGLIYKDLASSIACKAEGMGFEPTTPFGASDFESDRWPIRLPSEVITSTCL